MNAADIKEALERAAEDGDAILDAQIDVYVNDGVSYDQEHLTDTEFVPWYLDLFHSNALGPAEPPFTTMDFLPDLAPDLYKELKTRFERIAGKTMIGGL